PRRAPPEADSTREQAQAERRRYLADAGLGGTNGKDGPSAGGPGGERTSPRPGPSDESEMDRWMDEMEDWDP
ncbi:MAG: hypothetical protein GYA33_12195, partial [Thermogutta sp.]|nr:hypothetical protein [Thermogutta sp.]